MRWLKKLFEKRTFQYQSSDPGAASIFQYAPNHSGVNVTEQSAMQLSAVSSAVNVISNTVASQSFCPYQTKKDVTELASAHPAYKLFKLRANAHMSAFNFVQTIQSHALRWGNGFAWIEFDFRGFPIGLWPLAPWATTLVEDGGRFYYYTELLGKRDSHQIILNADEVLHIKAPGSDGYMGKSPIRQHAEELGIQIAAQNFGAEFFGNGAVIQGYLTLPTALKKEHKDDIKKSWKDVFAGTGNRHQTPVLSNGMEYKRIGIPPEEAQFLETRKYGDTKIAQIYNIPPHMIGDLSKATFSNITEETINFVRRTLLPWFTQWEQEATYKLFSTNEQKRLSLVFDKTKILRGTPKEEAEQDVSLTNAGIITRNEARKARNLNPIDGLDQILVPLNMVETDDDGQPLKSEGGNEDQGEEDQRKIDPMPLYERFSQQLANAVLKSSNGWNGQKFIDRNLKPICDSLSRTDVYDEFLREFVAWEKAGRPLAFMTSEVILNTLRKYDGI